jgi:hypothetical protein
MCSSDGFSFSLKPTQLNVDVIFAAVGDIVLRYKMNMQASLYRYIIASNVARLSSFSFHTALYIRCVYADNLNTAQPIRNDTCG